MSRDAFIWDGYMTAGAALIDEAVRRPHDRHGLVYPILFNYRHGLETAMKWTIGLYGRLANVELDDLDHDLLRLWRKCWAIFETAPRPAEDDTLDVVERIVIDFHELDKTAMAFRYSTSKNRATISLPDTAIDLQNVQDIMEGVNNFFHGADGLLSDLLSAAPERY